MPRDQLISLRLRSADPALLAAVETAITRALQDLDPRLTDAPARSESKRTQPRRFSDVYLSYPAQPEDGRA